MADREYSSTDAAHVLPGFSSNADWDKVQETGLWSHYPVQTGPKAGFHDPVAPAPARQQLQTAGGPGVADDTPAAEWPASDASTPPTLGQKGIPDGKGSAQNGPWGSGRHGGAERGNSPWFRGGPN